MGKRLSVAVQGFHPSSFLSEETARLRELAQDRKVISAVSGGVDSTYVAYVANTELGPRALCVTGESASVPEYQKAESDRLVEEFGFNRELINTDSHDYGGSNLGNGTWTHSQSHAAHGHAQSLSLLLPPLATLILQPEN